MLICQLCPEGDNEILPGTEFDHIKLMHSDVLDEVRQKIEDGTAPVMHTGNAFDVIRHMATMIEQRLVRSEAELMAAIEQAEIKAKFHEKQGHRYRAMIGFCDWLVAQIDAGMPLDPTVVRARAKKVRHAWPTAPEQEGASE